MIPSGSTICLSCTDPQLAALITRRPAVREDIDTECMRYFRDLLLNNYEAWCAFARVMDISAGDILLVTGHDLTNEWATAAVVGTTPGFKIEFKAGDNSSPVECISASAWGSWSSSVGLPLGPTFGNAVTRQSEHIPSEAHPFESDRPSPNQCIFVRAYRVSHRPQVVPGKSRVAVSIIFTSV